MKCRIVRLEELSATAAWQEAFPTHAKDYRWYEIVDQTLRAQFDYRCVLLEEGARITALQPFFFTEQDLSATAAAPVRVLVKTVRRVFPGFLRLKMLMAGCAAGEGHFSAQTLDPVSASQRGEKMDALRDALRSAAKAAGAQLIVWKDFPASCREMMKPLAQLGPLAGGNRRLASMPATRLRLEFTSFEDYLQRHLSRAMRKNLRRKFKALEGAAPITMAVVHDVSGVVDEVHALYSQVLARSPLQFEKLTKAFLLRVGAEMPDRVRFFLWRQNDRLVAFSLCLVHDGVLYDEYLGLDYRVALDLHLYFVTFRDVLTWAIGQGLREYRSTPLNYDPKLHLGFELVPLDLYAAHPNRWLNAILHALLPWFAPIRGERALRDFPNFADLES